MEDLEEFEKVLKEVVGAKRLSASKMTKVTELCIKNIANDTQLVSTLYLTHKKLPAGNKVFSLYVFDALARAARHQVTKHNITVDRNSDKGNCATFLSKVEGVLEGLVEDMLSAGVPELREKTKKILDIWTHSNTFPTAILSQLSARVKKEEEKASALPAPVQVPIPIKANPAPLPAAPAPNAPAPVLPQSLLALLGSAISAVPVNGQTSLSPPTAIGSTSTSNGTIPLDAAQIALLQQLASQALAAQASSAAAPPPSLPPAPKPAPIYGPNLPPPPDQIAAVKSFPPRDDDSPANRIVSRASRWDAGMSPPPRDERWERERRDDWHRGDGYRGRGRGFLNRGTWQDRPRNGDRSPPFYGRERSRSPPPRRFDPRSRSDDFPPGGRPYPPRRGSPLQRPESYRPRPPSPPPLSARDPRVPGASAPRTDEFGREVRDPDESEHVKAPAQPNVEAPLNAERADVPKVLAAASAQGEESVPSQASLTMGSTTLSTPSASSSGHATSAKQGGLDTFDYSTFDFTSPASWEALGKAWQVTYGSLPTQEELMMAIMGGGNAMMGNPMAGGNPMMGGSAMFNRPPAASNTNGYSGPPLQSVPVWDDGDNSSPYRETGWRDRGRGAGRGGFGGPGRAGYHNPGTDFVSSGEGAFGESEAIVLGGGDVDLGSGAGGDEGRKGGGMVKVGDRWEWQPAIP